ncbi:MAG: hypothetical protein NTZ68_01475 [Candidatus Dependentiae bacterium]|nr:hypothetical protein [Candidatus Dependentiae bacterium]
MKKTLLALTLISASQTMPEWREHHGFLGGVLNTSEAIVETPAYVVSPSYREDARARSDERRMRRDEERMRRDEQRIRRDEQRTKREEQQLNRDERRYKNGYDQNGYDQNGRRPRRGWFN